VTRVAHVITGLGVGGAELAMARLVAALDPAGERTLVVSLSGDGPVAGRLRAAGVPVAALRARGLGAPFAVAALARALRAWEPDVVQTWMYHADLLGGIAARMVNAAPVAWNLRMSEPVKGVERGATRAVVALNASLSRRLPHTIVCCSDATLRAHAALGYDVGRMRVIPNGFAMPRDAPARADARASLGLPPDALVVGRVGRWHPMKDHVTFLRAARLVVDAVPAVRFLLVGHGLEPDNALARAAVAAAGLADHAVLAGTRDDMGAVYAALDVLCSSSRSGEGFPNVIGEAMALGVPTVATDVGESAAIIGPHGVVVPPADPDALAAGLLRVLRLPPGERDALGQAAQARVRERYTMDQMAASYRSLYEELAHVRHRRRR